MIGPIICLIQHTHTQTHTHKFYESRSSTQRRRTGDPSAQQHFGLHPRPHSFKRSQTRAHQRYTIAAVVAFSVCLRAQHSERQWDNEVHTLIAYIPFKIVILRTCPRAVHVCMLLAPTCDPCHFAYYSEHNDKNNTHTRVRIFTSARGGHGRNATRACTHTHLSPALGGGARARCV